MGILAWILFGGLAGWVASIIAGRNEEQGILGNVIIGIIGAVVGGYLFQLLGGSGVTGFNLSSFFAAVVGAVILLFAARTLFHRP